MKDVLRGLFAVAALSLTVLLTGCLTEETSRRAENPLVTSAMLGFRGSRVQSVTGSWGERSFSGMCVLKGEGGRFTAVFLAPQMRLATLVLEPPDRIVWERSKFLPESLDPETVLFDLACVNLETAALRRALGREYRVLERRNGVRVVQESFSRMTVSERTVLPDGAIRFRNLRYGYEYTVKDAE